MKPLFCKCAQCKRGRYSHKWLFRHRIKAARSNVRKLIKAGVESLPERVYVGYVD